jgi:hypothetical protein
VSDCDFRGDWCTTHNKTRCTDKSCETGFFDPADWKDLMSDGDHRSARRSDIRLAIDALKRALSWQCAKIKNKTPEDWADESFIREAMTRLEAWTKGHQPQAPRRKRRR